VSPLLYLSNFAADFHLNQYDDLQNLRNIIRLYEVLYSDITTGCFKMVNEMVKINFTIANLEALVTGVAMPLHEAIYACRNRAGLPLLPNGEYFLNSTEAFDIIGRHDIQYLVNCDSDPVVLNPQPHFTDREVKPNTSARHSCPAVLERERVVKMRFSKDDRIEKVMKLMELPKESTITASIGLDLSPEEVANAQQRLLKRWSASVFSLCVGRALFNFDSSVIVSTDTFQLPTIPVSAKVPPLNTTQDLFIPPQSNLLEWPEFHAGVSAGLQIRQDCTGIDSSWIVFNQGKNREGKPEIDCKHGLTC
jgi:hypothetical protein